MNETDHSLLVRLADALELGFRQAVAQAQRKHAGERFYAYILYATPLLQFASPSFNTEEALAAIAIDVAECEELRWLPPEWKYHCEGQEFFEPVNDILGLLLDLQGYEEPGWKSRWNAFIEVLKRLDAQGVFAIGQARESVLVNIMWGDQDAVAHVESARELNPFASYIRYARHQAPVLKASEKETEGSPSMYKEEALARIRQAIAQVEEDLRKVT